MAEQFSAAGDFAGEVVDEAGDTRTGPRYQPADIARDRGGRVGYIPEQAVRMVLRVAYQGTSGELGCHSRIHVRGSHRCRPGVRHVLYVLLGDLKPRGLGDAEALIVLGALLPVVESGGKGGALDGH
jgi:hypothetical protein